MRTNIDIDDELMGEAMKATGAATKRAAVEKALRILVQLKAHENRVKEVFRRQELARNAAEREGRLEQWHEEVVRKGNWPEDADDADQRGD